MKKKTNYSFYSFFFLFPLFFFSQESLLDQIEYQNEDYRVGLSAFKAHKIVNGQSTKQSKEKELYLYVAHRFGNINEGISTLFGLDIANTKIEMLYGFSDNFQVGFSRESLDKTYSINFKNKIADQNSGFPLNITLYNSFNYNSSDFLAPGTELTFSQRSLFLTQILISNRVSDKISLQISPSFIKRNYNRERILFIDNIPTVTTYDRENNYLLGINSSYKINKRTSLNIEYNASLNRLDNSPNSDVLSIGLDLETGGHVFQLIFSNTQSMDDISSILDAEGNWSKNHIFFGFNILRVF